MHFQRKLSKKGNLHLFVTEKILLFYRQTAIMIYMKNNSNDKKTFSIQFPLSVILLGVAVLVLCAISIVVSVLQIRSLGINGFSDLLKYPFLICLSLFGIALIVSLFIKSQYVITDTQFISQFGFIKSKTEIKTITSISLNTDTQKLTLYFGEEFTVLSFTKDWNEEFVRALLEKNPNISYSFTSANSNESEPKA